MAEYGLAEGLYQNHYLADDLYEEWTQQLRNSLWQSYLMISYRLSQYYLSHKDFTATIAINLRILDYESSQEEAHLNLMKCYLAQGQRYLAISQYQRCVQTLKNELDISPSHETQEFYQKLIEGHA